MSWLCKHEVGVNLSQTTLLLPKLRGGGRSTPDHPKSSFSPCKNPINIHTRESPKLDYNIVEDLRKLKGNILVMDIVSTRSHPWIAAEVSPIPISVWVDVGLNVDGRWPKRNNMKDVQHITRQEMHREVRATLTSDNKLS
jgi:hypothetical protein